MKTVRFYTLTKTKVTREQRDQAHKRCEQINKILNEMIDCGEDCYSEYGNKLWDEWFDQFDIMQKFTSQAMDEWQRRIAAEKRNKPK